MKLELCHKRNVHRGDWEAEITAFLGISAWSPTVYPAERRRSAISIEGRFPRRNRLDATDNVISLSGRSLSLENHSPAWSDDRAFHPGFENCWLHGRGEVLRSPISSDP